MILQPRDKAISAYLDYYGTLPSNFLAHLIEGKYSQGFRRRLQDLKAAKRIHAPQNQKLSPNDQSAYRKPKFRVYENGGKKRYGVGFAHHLMSALIEANFEIAGRQLGLQFVSWEQIRALPDTPYKTALSENPFKLSANWDEKEHVFYPDGHPFKLQGPGGAYSFLFEADRDTEGNRNLTPAQRPYIEAKLRNYLAFTRTKDYQRHFGFKSLFVLFVTTSPTKCAHFEKLLLDITDGKGAANILFKPFPDYLDMDGSLQPDLPFVTEPWQRAGHEAFDLIRPLGGKKIVA